jgi:hypothetical protein
VIGGNRGAFLSGNREDLRHGGCLRQYDAVTGGGERLIDGVCDTIVPEIEARRRLQDATTGNRVQHSRQTFGTHILQISDRNLLQNCLVECNIEVCIQEPTMGNGQAEKPSNEFEVAQVSGVDASDRADLEGIVAVGGVWSYKQWNGLTIYWDSKKKDSPYLSLTHDFQCIRACGAP